MDIEPGEPQPLPPGVEPAPGYRILGHLARGNRLDVYDGWSVDRCSRCVLKMLRPDRVGDLASRRALLREGRLLQSLSHPHIVRGYETVDAEQPVVVLETLGGETLDYMIEEGGCLSPAEAAQLGLQLGSAIRYLHRHRILHLDLKPANVIADSAKAKLIDLSIARPPGRLAAGTGTWCYMAPEQSRGGGVGRAADVWGLGAVLFEALSGDPPFDDEGEEHPQLTQPAPRLEERSREPGELGPVVDTCLAHEPSARPSVEQLLTRLAVIAEPPVRERRWSGA